MKKCFVISPIDKEGSAIRKNADQVFKHIIKPAIDQCGIEAFRSDHLDKPGKISEQMFDAINNADLCIADLTGRNPNVYYELAIAQSANRPVIILIKKGEPLPFDVRDFRYIPYDFDPDEIAEGTYCKKVVNYIKEYQNNEWFVKDVFSAFRQPSLNVDEGPIDFDEIKHQLEKTIIFKMINLKSIDESSEAIYQRYIPRIDKTVGVTSEFVAIRINKFDRKIRQFKSRDRTSGDAIEVNALFPYDFNIEDTDRNAKLIQPIIEGPSDIYIATSHTYNGFKVGELDISTKAEKNTDLVRLIVDFSSIPNFHNLISKDAQLHYCPYPGKPKMKEEEQQYELLADGIYFAQKENMKEGDVLRFDFFATEKEY